jgi:hypothetical protein
MELTTILRIRNEVGDENHSALAHKFCIICSFPPLTCRTTLVQFTSQYRSSRSLTCLGDIDIIRCEEGEENG